MWKNLLFYFFKCCEGIIRHFLSLEKGIWGEFKCRQCIVWSSNQAQVSPGGSAGHFCWLIQLSLGSSCPPGPGTDQFSLTDQILLLDPNLFDSNFQEPYCFQLWDEEGIGLLDILRPCLSLKLGHLFIHFPSLPASLLPSPTSFHPGIHPVFNWAPAVCQALS